jgi:hypothetical protein
LPLFLLSAAACDGDNGTAQTPELSVLEDTNSGADGTDPFADVASDDTGADTSPDTADDDTIDLHRRYRGGRHRRRRY